MADLSDNQLEEKEAPSEFNAAGTIFTNGTHVLAGYQPNRPNPCISGIGGKREGDEEFLHTALREMLEELLCIYDESELLASLKELEPRRILKHRKYMMVVYSFDDLEKMLEIVKNSGITSQLYDEIPLTLSTLIFKRLSKKSEISHLSILPLVKHGRDMPFIESYFLKDLQMLL